MGNTVLEHIPDKIGFFLADRELVPITRMHRSGDQVFSAGEDYILKVSDERERLFREKTANDYLYGKLSVSRSVCFEQEGSRSWYLKTKVPGTPLAYRRFLSDPQTLISHLARAFETLQTVDASDCPILNPDSCGTQLVHGDFCLPNILVQPDGNIAFIDTEAAGLGDVWVDYSWCIWSLEYNLKSKAYTPLLLDRLGISFDEAKYRLYVDHPL